MVLFLSTVNNVGLAYECPDKLANLPPEVSFNVLMILSDTKVPVYRGYIEWCRSTANLQSKWVKILLLGIFFLVN